MGRRRNRRRNGGHHCGDRCFGDCFGPRWGGRARHPASRPIRSAQFLPVLKKYCFECHRGSGAQGDIRLDRFPTAATVLEDRETWRRVAHMLQVQEMPPEKSLKPSDAAQDGRRLDRSEPAVARAAGRGEPRPRYGPAAEPRRIRQHHPRSAGRSIQRRGRFPRRRRGLRLRQHRRRAHASAAADGEVPVRRRANRRQGRRPAEAHREAKHRQTNATSRRSFAASPPGPTAARSATGSWRG